VNEKKVLEERRGRIKKERTPLIVPSCHEPLDGSLWIIWFLFPDVP
jgi:hypothetical protein